MKETRSLTVVVLALVVSCLAVSAAMAQDPSQASGQKKPQMMCQDRFTALDKNQDGAVDKDEFMSIQHPGADPEGVFKSRDTNKDGRLTRDEFCAGKGYHGGRSQ